MLIAITRQISLRFNECELTHLDRQPIDLELARAQHHEYEAALRELGCEVISLSPEADLPDSVFVEDVALVFDEVAIITRPGADSRKPETESIVRALSPYRKLCFIKAPGTLDGGDVLRVGQTVYIGLSSRSNRSAVEQTQMFLAPYGYTVKGVEVTGCLHLKSAVTQVSEDTLLINSAWVDRSIFGDMKFIEVDESEPSAANAVWIDDAVIYPSSFPKTQRRLEEAGLHLRIVDATEVAKAEGAVTCCSLIFRRS
ncbi:MAG TPA: arginine deiminase-related protein [Anaerolineae bacterium]|nr:arginine deiminase-related protein [Anaerolineae bacterium]